MRLNGWVRGGVFIAALTVFLAHWGRNYSWDVIERASFLKYQAEAPAWGLFFFAHLLEVPVAAGIMRLSGGLLSPLGAFQLLESVAAALCVLLVYDCCLLAGGKRLRAIGMALLLMVSHGFWRMAVTGEEKILASFFITLFLSLWLPLGRTAVTGRRRAALVVVTGLTLGVAALVHLMAAILWLLLAAGILLSFFGVTVSRFSARESLVIGITGLILFLAVLAPVAAGWYGIDEIDEVMSGLLLYHSPRFSFWYFAQPETERHLLRNMRDAVAGISRVILPGGLCGKGAGWCGGIALAALFAGVGGAIFSLRRNVLARGCLLFLLLWAPFYLFFEPHNPESWICAYPAFLIMLCSCAAGFPPVARRWSISVLFSAAVLLLIVNLPSFAALRGPHAAEKTARMIEQRLSPEGVLIVGDGMEQRYTRYFSSYPAILVDHLTKGSYDWFDTAKMDLRALRKRLDEGRPVYATRPALSRLPGWVRGERIEGSGKEGLYRLRF